MRDNPEREFVMVDVGLVMFLLAVIVGILYVVGDLRQLAIKSAAETARQARAAKVQRVTPYEPRTDYDRNDFIPYEFRQAA